MKTLYTISDGKIGDVMQCHDDYQHGPEWRVAPNDWGGYPGDKLEWFNEELRRIPNQELVRQGKRVNNIGRVYNTEDRSSRMIFGLDEELSEDETREEPLQNEPYQKFDRQRKTWIIDTEKKKTAEKDTKISVIQSAIDDAERKIQRSTRAKLDGTATDDDEKFYSQINAEITRLRQERQQLLSA